MAVPSTEGGISGSSDKLVADSPSTAPPGADKLDNKEKPPSTPPGADGVGQLERAVPGARDLKAEALSMRHLLLHWPKNHHCWSCRVGMCFNAPARRSDTIPTAKVFGDISIGYQLKKLVLRLPVLSPTMPKNWESILDSQTSGLHFTDTGRRKGDYVLQARSKTWKQFQPYRE